MHSLNATQERAVKWYIGDVSGNDPFWGDAKAYVTVNSLFFPGLGTERCRAAEGKPLDPAILSDAARLRAVLRDLLSAFAPLPEALTTYRVERFADFSQMQSAGHTLSFTSTSTAGFLPAYQDRRGIALMRFSLPQGTRCIRMADALPHYAKADEAEVLLPPGMGLHIEKLPLTPAELQILDADGKPPVISVGASPCKAAALPQASPIPDGHLAGMRVLSALRKGSEPAPADADAYIRWKAAFVRELLQAGTI